MGDRRRASALAAATRAILVGTVVTVAVLTLAMRPSPGLTALEWAAYDGWLASRAPVAPERGPVVITRDPVSEARFGSGVWDRAVLARVVTALARAGASAIGLDVRVGVPSPPARGGASSDALLSQAAALAEIVVYPLALDPREPGGTSAGTVHPSWPERSQIARTILDVAPSGAAIPGSAQAARALGHTLAPPDRDGVVRRVPLFVGLGDRAVPAFGLAMAAAAADVRADGIGTDGRAVILSPRPGGTGRPMRIPVDAEGRALVLFGGATRGVANEVPFDRVWQAIESGATDTLQTLVDDRPVLVLAEPAGDRSRTPRGPMSQVEIQAHLLTSVLSGRGVREPGTIAVALSILVATIVVAWLGLALRWWIGPLVGAVAVAAYVASRPLGLDAGIALPLVAPVAAVTGAIVIAFVANVWTSGRRVRHLEGEIDRVQHELGSASDALVRQESTVEALEEDLEMARAAVARSTGAERDLVRAADALREELAGARVQEAETRRRLQGLESQLRGLRAADVRATPLGDAERERARVRCEALGILTRDPAVLAAFRDLEKAARTSLPILITGEPGTGKELFARAAHALGARPKGPFVAVNMAAIPVDLFESELFGHVKGSFTGAVSDRRGHFEQADGGTIFLDEVGDLRPEHQSKLLRVLQDQTFHRVGASRPTSVDVRVIAATNRDLERGIAEGWFREDLYFRLKGFVLRLPALRERPDDIPLLAARVLDEFAADTGRPGLALSAEAMRALQGHAWDGNVRELQHCLRQAVTLAEGTIITEADLRLTSPSRRAPAGTAPTGDADGDQAVLECLRRTRFDMRAAAETLGWDRSTVTQRLKGLGFRALVESAGNHAAAAAALAGDPTLARTVETKLREYHEHLLRVVRDFDSADAAVAACRRRFKNLPERHFRSLDTLVRDHFSRT